MSLSLNVVPTTITKSVSKITLNYTYVFNATDATIMVYYLDASGSVQDATSVYIPPEVYASWTTDDAVIIDYVLSQLSLTPA